MTLDAHVKYTTSSEVSIGERNFNVKQIKLHII